MTTFDDLLEEAGSFGRYQRRIFALLCLMPAIYAGAYVGIVFQGFTPDHWCRDPAVVARRESCGWSPEDSRRLTVPFDNSSGVLQQDSCAQYEVDWNSTALTCDTQGLDLSGTPISACKVTPPAGFSHPGSAVEVTGCGGIVFVVVFIKGLDQKEAAAWFWGVSGFGF